MFSGKGGGMSRFGVKMDRLGFVVFEKLMLKQEVWCCEVFVGCSYAGGW